MCIRDRLKTMQERNFGVGVAYSKSEVLQVALFAFVFLGDPVTIPLAIAVAFGTAGVLLVAAFALLVAQGLQTALLGGYLLLKEPRTVAKAVRQWRPSLLAGFMGAAASAGWFTAFAIEPAAHVRTLGL